LGVPASFAALTKANLIHRELWYFDSVNLPSQFIGGLSREIALPPPPTKLAGQVTVPGWKRQFISTDHKDRLKELKTKETEFWDLLTEAAWGSHLTQVDVSETFWSEVKASGFEGSWRAYCARNHRVAKFRKCGFVSDPVKRRLMWKPMKEYCRQREMRRTKLVAVWVFEGAVEEECFDTLVDVEIPSFAPSADLTESSWLKSELAASLYLQ